MKDLTGSISKLPEWKQKVFYSSEKKKLSQFTDQDFDPDQPEIKGSKYAKTLIAKELEECFMLVSLKRENWPDELEGKLLVNFIYQNHQDLAPEEITSAFTHVIVNSIENLVKHFQTIGPDYVHRILNSYKAVRARVLIGLREDLRYVNNELQLHENRIKEYVKFMTKMVGVTYKEFIDPEGEGYTYSNQWFLIREILKDKYEISVSDSPRADVMDLFAKWEKEGKTPREIFNYLKEKPYIPESFDEERKHIEQKIRLITG